VKLLAAGGMGAVLLAHHEILDKPVAIKLIRPELATRKEVAQRFLREARAAAKISSDYVARVTDVDLLDDKTPYMVMEYLEGEDLSAVMSAQPKLPIALAVDYVVQGLMGLAAAHAKGIVHRDLKPSNLFLERRSDGKRRVKLLDFGISKVLEGEADEALKAGATTSAGQMLGTPRYMSPEQVASAKNVDARTDLWAMGLILYEMLTGVYPFEGSSSGQILAAILTTSINPLRELRPEASPELQDVLERCLAKSRDDRYPDSQHMMRALSPFASKRVQSLIGELDDVLGDPTQTVKSPDAVQAVTPPGTGSSTPERRAGAATAATRVHSPLNTELAAGQQAVVATRVSGGASEAGARGGASTPAGGPPERRSLEGAARGGPSTEISMFSDSSAPGRSSWKLAAVAAMVAAAGFVAFWWTTRDPPGPGSGPETSPSHAASSQSPVDATARPVIEPLPGVSTCAATVITPVFPDPAVASASSSPVASVAAHAVPPTFTGPRPKASTAPKASSSGVRLNTRD
jgi:serine/threonine protein kinase